MIKHLHWQEADQLVIVYCPDPRSHVGIMIYQKRAINASLPDRDNSRIQPKWLLSAKNLQIKFFTVSCVEQAWKSLK